MLTVISGGVGWPRRIVWRLNGWQGEEFLEEQFPWRWRLISGDTAFISRPIISRQRNSNVALETGKVKLVVEDRAAGRRWVGLRKPACTTLWLLLSIPHCGCGFRVQGEEEKFRQLREGMVRTQIAQPESGAPAVRDPRVLQVMRQVPRHRFVPPAMVPYAYEDSPLPIGYDQTISEPYIVAKMTELTEPKPSDRALEVGTGSGYQAAVLASLVAEVYTIEIVEPLGINARERLRALGYKNVEVRIGDGYQGWPEKAPFGIILVTAAAEKIPPLLLEQLKPGGRMVMPLAKMPESQVLTLVRKGSKDPRDISIWEILPVRFVPLVRGPQEGK